MLRQQTIRRLLVACAAALFASGCTTVADFAGIARPGHQPDGSYVLKAAEADMDCRGLTSQVEQSLVDMKEARDRMPAERDALPPTLKAAYGRVFGGSDGGLKNATIYRQSETRARSLNRQLGSKSCAIIDIDARIRAFDEPAVNAVPVAMPASPQFAAPAVLTTSSDAR